MTNVYETLKKVNFEGRLAERDGLDYIPWSIAWDEVLKVYPGATYDIWKDENHRPYIFDEDLGYMVFTSVTINSETKEMWMTVLDKHNQAMKKEPYNVVFKSGKKFTINKASMADINRAIMRCLTKNLAMFGLGLYIYNKEEFTDDPEEKAEEPKPNELKPQEPKPQESKKKNLILTEPEQVQMPVLEPDPRLVARDRMIKLGKQLGYTVKQLMTMYHLSQETTIERFNEIYEGLQLELEERSANEESR